MAIYRCWVRKLRERGRSEKKNENISKLLKTASCPAQVQRSLFILEPGGEARRDLAASLLGASIGTPPSVYFYSSSTPCIPPRLLGRPGPLGHCTFVLALPQTWLISNPVWLFLSVAILLALGRKCITVLSCLIKLINNY